MRSALLALGYCLAVAIPVPGCAAPVCIDGVKSMGWETKRWSQQIAALYSALDAMGCPMPYDELMVGSGAAFTMAWWPGWYSYGAPEVAPEDLILNGAEAAGAEAQRRNFNSPEDVWQAICQSIDEQRPVVSWKGKAWGTQVICGYDPQSNSLHVRHYNTQGEPYAVVPFESPGAPHPLSRDNEIVLINYDANWDVPELDWPRIIDRTIGFADWPPQEKLYGIYVFGLGAYDAWAQTLRQGLDGNGAETDAILTEYMTRVISGARAAASVVFLDNAGVHEAFADAATRYMREAEILGTMAGVLSQGQGLEWNEMREAMTANFPRPEVREQAAQLVEQAKEEEIMAVDALRLALADLRQVAGGAPPEAGEGGPVRAPSPPRPVPPTVLEASDGDVADEHCKQGSRLKAQGRYREAVEELQAAIEADPKHVEAHRVLAWVLVGLKDTDGAATEFRKVIELAPGTDKATEAQKALERLGK